MTKSMISSLKLDLKNAKNKLIKKVKRVGIYENFGVKELRDIQDKYSSYSGKFSYEEGLKASELIQEFADWSGRYNGE